MGVLLKCTIVGAIGELLPYYAHVTLSHLNNNGSRVSLTTKGSSFSNQTKSLHDTSMYEDTLLLLDSAQSSYLPRNNSSYMLVPGGDH